MSLYVIKNDEGKYLSAESFVSAIWADDLIKAGRYATLAGAQSAADDYDGHVAELIEKPEPVEVTEEEAKVLEEAKRATYPADWISNHAHLDPSDNNTKYHEEHLMRAYVNGWKAAKPKRYVLPMEGTEYHNGAMKGTARYYAVKTTNNWRPDGIAVSTGDAADHGYTVTQADIDAAPKWVRDLEKVEVRDE